MMFIMPPGALPEAAANARIYGSPADWVAEGAASGLHTAQRRRSLPPPSAQPCYRSGMESGWRRGSVLPMPLRMTRNAAAIIGSRPPLQRFPR